MNIGRKLKEKEKRFKWTDQVAGDFVGDSKVLNDAKIYERKGFGFVTPGYTIPRVVVDGERVVSGKEIQEYFKKNRLEHGNSEHIQLKEAYEYLALWGQWTRACFEA